MHLQAEKFKSFRSNNVNLIITTCFTTHKQNLIRHEPFSSRTKKWQQKNTIKNNTKNRRKQQQLVLNLLTSFYDVFAKHFAD